MSKIGVAGQEANQMVFTTSSDNSIRFMANGEVVDTLKNAYDFKVGFVAVVFDWLIYTCT